MGLEERDYMKEEHYPSCTCVACCRKRYERAARVHWCDRHDRPVGPSGCHLCRMEGLADTGPDSPPDQPPRANAGGPPARMEKPAGDDGRGQHATRLGDTLRGILGRKHGG